MQRQLDIERYFHGLSHLPGETGEVPAAREEIRGEVRLANRTDFPAMKQMILMAGASKADLNEISYFQKRTESESYLIEREGFLIGFVIFQIHEAHIEIEWLSAGGQAAKTLVIRMLLEAVKSVSTCLSFPLIAFAPTFSTRFHSTILQEGFAEVGRSTSRPHLIKFCWIPASKGA